VDKWLTLAGWGLLFVLFVVNGGSLAAALLTAPSTHEAWDEISEQYSPANLWVHVRNVLLLFPAVGIFLWRDRRRRQHAAFRHRR
jgi:hypothetical protein